MFDSLRKTLYFGKEQLLFEKGIKEGSIKLFDDEFYEKMSHTYIDGLPVSMHIKYFKPKFSPGRCYERSLYMFFCFPNAILVRGDNKELEFLYGKDNAHHGWIEMDGYCYDPTLLKKYKKDIYYEMYKPYNITKITMNEYINESGSNKLLYEDIVNTKLSDFQPGGRKRIDLLQTIPLVHEIAKMSTNEDFKRELNEYLATIQYDERQIYEELDLAFQNCLKDKIKNNIENSFAINNEMPSDRNM